MKLKIALSGAAGCGKTTLMQKLQESEYLKKLDVEEHIEFIPEVVRGLKAGRIPTPPDILLNTMHGGVEIQYLGPLAQAQTRLTKVRAIQSFLSLAGQVAQFDTTVPHYVDAEYTLRELGDAVGVPVGCIRTPKQITAIQQQIAQNAQQEQTAENVPKLAKAAANLAKQPEAGSILQKLMGGGDDAGA